MKKEMKELIALYPRLSSKTYVFLKNLLTPFDEIDSSIPRKGKIVDIGCGIGMYSFYLKLRAPQRRIVGIDNNLRRIAYANGISRRARYKTVEFLYTDLNEDYSLENCDAYLINDVLHHIPYKSKKVLLKKVFDKMTKGNVLVIKDMESESRLKFMLNYVSDKIMTMNGKLDFVDPGDMLSLLRRIGYKVDYRKIRGYLFPHILYVCRKY